MSRAQSRWLPPWGDSSSGLRLRMSCPARAVWGSALDLPGRRCITAGYQAYPQPVSFQAKGRRQLKIPQGSQGDGGTPIVNQYLTPLINKMLFHNTKLSAIIITTKRRTVG